MNCIRHTLAARVRIIFTFFTWPDREIICKLLLYYLRKYVVHVFPLSKSHFVSNHLVKCTMKCYKYNNRKIEKMSECICTSSKLYSTNLLRQRLYLQINVAKYIICVNSFLLTHVFFTLLRNLLYYLQFVKMYLRYTYTYVYI